MRVIWEAEDIVVGRRYSKPGLDEEWIIGFIGGMGGPIRYVSISDQDGMVTGPKSKEEIALDLTEAGYLPVELLGKR